MSLRDVQATFGGGELTPALWGRTDIQKYKTGLKTGRNVNIIPQGGARNRPGTQYVASAGDSTHAVRLVEFIASTSQSYVLELGNFYMRFYKGGVSNPLLAQVQATITPAWASGFGYVVGNYVLASGVIYYCLVAHTSGVFATDLAAGKWEVLAYFQVPTPWAADDIFKVKFVQSADVMFFAHPNYQPQKLTFYSNSNWTMTPYGFIQGPFMVQNTDTTFTLTPSAISGGSGTPENVSTVSIYGSGNNLVTIITAAPHGMVENQQTTLSGFTGALASLNGSYGVHISGASQLTLKVLNSTSYFFTTIAAGTYSGLAGPPVETPSSVPITLTASAPLFVANQIGALFQLQRTVVAQTVTDSGFTANTYASASIKCGSTWSIITLGSWNGKILVQVSIDNATWVTVQTLQSDGNNNFTTTGATGYSQCYLRVSADPLVAWSGTMTMDLTAPSFDWNGIVQITAVATSLSASAVVISNPGNAWPLADTNSTYQWSEGSWSNYRGWPTCVTFYQDRVAWASTVSEPTTVWHTKTSSYYDFGVSEPLIDSDAFSVVLASRRLNAVNFLVPMPQALIASSGDMSFGLSPGPSGIYSATSIQQSPMDHRGSYNVDPVVVGNEIVLLQQMGTVVRNLIFQLAVNGFMGDNISVSSQHLFTGYSIVQMAYQQEPDSIIWAVRNDGVLLSCTYDRGQEMNAWTHHDTQGGTFESVCSIPNPGLGINEIWVVVNRTLQGFTTRTIERLMPRDQGTNPSFQWFVDCGAQYNSVPAQTISVPAYLNGQTVAVYADGNVVANGVNDETPIVVTASQITLPVAASVITVGFPIIWDVGLLDIETQNQKGPLQGQRIKMPRAKVRCWNSRGGYISTTPPASSTGLLDTNGQSFDALMDIMLRDPETNMDTPLPLVTGIVDAALPSGYQYGAAICLRGIDPLPFTLLDVIPTVVIGGD